MGFQDSLEVRRSGGAACATVEPPEVDRDTGRAVPGTGKHVAWVVPLGTRTYSTPVVGGGRVLIGTNNGRPRNPRHTDDRSVLMCFDEVDGRFRWQLVVPKMSDKNPYLDWPRVGIVSPATIEGDRAYLLTNRGEVVCLDMAPMIDGRCLYVGTSNGVDRTHRRMITPDAPSLVCLDTETGRLLAVDGARIGPQIIHSQWSSASRGRAGGRDLVCFGGGDAVCYAFEPVREPLPEKPQTLRTVWRFDCDPAGRKEHPLEFQDNRDEGPSLITGMPVFVDGRVYVTAGGDYWHGKPECWIKCIDASGTGDVTRSHEVWSRPLNRHCMSTPAVADGLVSTASMPRPASPSGRTRPAERYGPRPSWPTARST